MPKPQLDNLNFLLSGKKDLSPLVVAKCEKVIHNLKKITGDDEIVEALNRIGLIYIYLNQFDDALAFFEKAYEKSNLEAYFLNIVRTLERKGEYLSAIKRTFDYLENNLNSNVLRMIIKLLCRYPSIRDINHLKLIIEKKVDIKIRDEFLNMVNQINERVVVLNKVGVSIQNYALIKNIIFMSINYCYYQKGSDDIDFKLSITIDNDLFEKVRIFNADYEDIIELNALYDTKVQQFIEQGKLTLDEYFDILSKYSFSFVIHTESKEEWEKTCATS